MAKKKTTTRRATSRTSKNVKPTSRLDSVKRFLLKMDKRQRMALFVVTFGVLGLITLVPLFAQNEIPGRSDEIVFEVSEGMGVDTVTKTEDGTMLYSQSPYLMRLMGDGTLLCDDGSLVAFAKGNVNSSAVRGLYTDVMAEGLFDLVDDTVVAQDSEIVSDYKTVTIGNIQYGTHRYTISKDTDTERKDAIERVSSRLMRECAKLSDKAEKLPIKDLPKAKENANEKSMVQRVLSFVDGPNKAQASHRTGHGGGGTSTETGGSKGGKKNNTTTSTDSGDTTTTTDTSSQVSGQSVTQGRASDVAKDQYDRANAHRATYPIWSLPRGSCIDEVAYRWAEKMATAGQISHNNNRTSEVQQQCGRTDWVVSGENVGVGYDSASLFQAFLNSTCHHANIDSRQFTNTSTSCGYAAGSYVGQTKHNDSGWGAYRTADGRIFVTQIFWQWSGGSTPTIPSARTVPVAYDNASCHAISVSKTTVAPGEQFLATIQMYNAGNVTWTMGSGGGYWRLGSSGSRNNTVWGVSRANSSGSVAPGGIATFQFYATVPSYADGTYSFNWEMLKESTYWLADQTPQPDGQTLYPVCKQNLTIKRPTTTTTTTSPTPTTTTTTTTTTSTDRITIGRTLYRGDRVYSANRTVFLILQTDGNLVLYGNSGSSVIWSSYSSTGYRAVMQSDGNFVLYNSSGGAVWHAGMGGKGGQFIKIQDDKRMVMYNSSSQAIWWKP